MISAWQEWAAYCTDTCSPLSVTAQCVHVDPESSLSSSVQPQNCCSFAAD